MSTNRMARVYGIMGRIEKPEVQKGSLLAPVYIY